MGYGAPVESGRVFQAKVSGIAQNLIGGRNETSYRVSDGYGDWFAIKSLAEALAGQIQEPDIE